MPTLPSESMILLLPVGEEFSTVDEATKNSFIDNTFAVAADKKLLCHWLFNAKQIEVHQVDTDSSSPTDETQILYAGIRPAGTVATTDPLPFNEIYAFGDLGCPSISAQPNHIRWVPAATLRQHYFYVFVYAGVWYWTPGEFLTDQSVSILNDTSFTVSAPSGDGTITVTYTIQDTFY